MQMTKSLTVTYVGRNVVVLPLLEATVKTEGQANHRKAWHTYIIVIYMKRYFIHVAIAVKRHRDQDNSCKGKHLIRACLRFLRWVHCHRGREHGGMYGRHGAGEAVESYSPIPKDSEGASKHGILESQSQPLMAHFFQPSHPSYSF